eukprot:754082-Pelagomonas_calceolata.AAC.2
MQTLLPASQLLPPAEIPQARKLRAVSPLFCSVTTLYQLREAPSLSLSLSYTPSCMTPHLQQVSCCPQLGPHRSVSHQHRCLCSQGREGHSRHWAVCKQGIPGQSDAAPAQAAC